MNDTHSAAEVGQRYGKSEWWVEQQCRTKKWPHLRVGKTPRFTDDHLADIDQMLEVASEAATKAKATSSWGRRGRSA